METKNFQQLQNELNQNIINEVKSVLAKIPKKRFKFTSARPHIVISRDEYNPIDVALNEMWIDDDKLLNFKSGMDEYDEFDDLLNIVDLQYAIDEMNRMIIAMGYNAEKVVELINPKYYHLLWPESQEWLEHEQAIPSEGMSCFIPCNVYDGGLE